MTDPHRQDDPSSRRWTVLPHEWAFNGFLALTTLRLACAAGMADPHTLLFLAYTLFGPALILWCGRAPTPLRWRIRLLWYPSVMGLSYYALAGAIAALHVTGADARLAAWDLALFGVEPVRLFAAVQSPPLTGLMLCAYLFFFWYLIAGPAHYCIHDLPRFRVCFAGLFTTYALGFLGYTLWPAAGPHLAMTGLPPLTAGSLADVLLGAVNGGSNGVDVFPSIHAAVSLYLLLFDARHYRARFRWTLLPCVLLWVSTLYLRYHYAVDLLAGAVIAAAGLVVAWLYGQSGTERALARAAVTQSQ